MNIQALFFTAFLLSVSSLALAQHTNRPTLIVIQDYGGTPTLPYYEELGLTAKPLPYTSTPPAPSVKPVTDADMLPIYSQQLSPGHMTSRKIQAPGLRPFFLIGDDELSIRWLLYKKEDLLKINAVGLVVNVQTANRLEALRALVPNLILSPVSGDDIAQRLNVKHYPVLITSTTIEQ